MIFECKSTAKDKSYEMLATDAVCGFCSERVKASQSVRERERERERESSYAFVHQSLGHDSSFETH